jgi:hypothetical protein
MKLYDYAARGRPIVSTMWAEGLDGVAPPSTRFATDSTAFAAAVLEAANSDPSEDLRRRAWAQEQTWERRFASWREIVLA